MIGSSLRSKTVCLFKPSLIHSLYSSRTHFLSELSNKLILFFALSKANFNTEFIIFGFFLALVFLKS